MKPVSIRQLWYLAGRGVKGRRNRCAKNWRKGCHQFSAGASYQVSEAVSVNPYIRTEDVELRDYLTALSCNNANWCDRICAEQDNRNAAIQDPLHQGHRCTVSAMLVRCSIMVEKTYEIYCSYVDAEQTPEPAILAAENAPLYWHQ